MTETTDKNALGLPPEVELQTTAYGRAQDVLAIRKAAAAALSGWSMSDPDGTVVDRVIKTLIRHCAANPPIAPSRAVRDYLRDTVATRRKAMLLDPPEWAEACAQKTTATIYEALCELLEVPAAALPRPEGGRRHPILDTDRRFTADGVRVAVASAIGGGGSAVTREAVARGMISGIMNGIDKQRPGLMIERLAWDVKDWIDAPPPPYDRSYTYDGANEILTEFFNSWQRDMVG